MALSLPESWLALENIILNWLKSLHSTATFQLTGNAQTLISEGGGSTTIVHKDGR